jgi:hypothetical protein
MINRYQFCFNFAFNFNLRRYSTLLATAWPLTAGNGHLAMRAISWGQAWFVWG